MRTSVTVILAAALAACSPPVPTTAAVTLSDGPVTLSLGTGERAASSLPAPFDGWVSVAFPARLSNATSESLWYPAQSADHPWSTTWISPPDSDEWESQHIFRCATGAGFHELEAGETVSFRVSVPVEHEGGRLRVEVVLYSEPSFESTEHRVRSQAARIQ